MKLCGGEFAADVPPPTVADTNTSGGEPDVQSTDASGGAGVVTESAAAYRGSEGTGEFTGGHFGVPGVLGSRVADASPRPRWIPALRRGRMISEVRVGNLSLVNGLVELGGMAWHLEQVVTGADDRSHEASQVASFTVGSRRGRACPCRPDHQSRCSRRSNSANTVLAPFGLHLRLPALAPEGQRGWRLTPLTVAVGGDTAGLGPGSTPSSLAARTPRS